MFKQFSSPWSLAVHVGKDLLVNGSDILKEVVLAQQFYLTAKYEDAGEQIGEAIAKTVVGKEKPEQSILTPAHDASQIVIGLLEGAIQAEGLDNIEACIANSEQILKDVEIAVRYLEKEDAQDVLLGLKQLGKVVFEIIPALKNCKGVEADFVKLEKMAAIFSNPASFAYHVGKDLIVNGASIYRETKDAVVQYRGGHYKQFGYDIGEALSKLILGEKFPEPVTPAYQPIFLY